jgi:hypothetical protein
MQRETTQEQTKSHTFVIIVDEDVAAYIEEKNITDTNAYMTKLLRAEYERKHGKRSKVGRAAH